MIARNISILVLLAGITIAVGQDSQKPSCAVIGFVNQVENKEWHDGRVGMGVRSMLAQSLFETGLFTLLEEKADIKAKIEEAANAAWLDKSGRSLDSASAFGRQAGAKFVASGKVFHFGKPRTKASVGPAHFESDEVEIKIEVTLTSTLDNKAMSAVGSGKAKTTASTGLFTFHGENLDADASMVGTATRKAIDAAVAEIAKKYRKVYKVK
jgi:curli biogenesis system outer membrane secretion channel CsgG